MPSLPKPLLALVRPDRAFADWRPSVRLALAAVVLVAVVNAAGLLIATEAVAGSVSGTATVDNPDRPSETMCEMWGEDDPFADDPNVTSGVTENCQTEPKTINVSLADAARDGASEQVPGAFVVPLVGWMLAGAVGLLFVGDGVDDRYSTALTVAGWGILPAGVRYAVRPLAVEQAAATWQHPTGNLEAVEAAARVLVSQDPAG